MFCRTGVHKNFALLEFFFFIKLQACRPAIVIKRRLQHRCLSVKFEKSLKVFFYGTLPVAASGNILWTLSIAYENNEPCHCVVRIGSPAFISFYCVCFVSCYFLLFLNFFVDFTTCLGIEVSLSILIIKQWSCS